MGVDTPFRARFGVQSRAITYADSATITPNANTSDICIITSLSQASTIANPTTTNPYDGQLLQIRITSITSQAISFGTAYQAASSFNLPQFTTGGSKKDYIAFRYNLIDTKWDLVATTGLVNAGIVRSIISISTGTTAAAAANIDYVYLCLGTITYIQPTAVGNTNRYTIKNIGTGVVTITFTSGQNADGSTTLAVNAGVSLDLISNNTNWIIV